MSYRIEDEHLAEQVHRLVRGMRAECVEHREGWRLGRPAQHVGAGALAGVTHILHGGRAKQLGNQLQLLHRILCLEEDATAQQLAKNAAHRPYIHRRRVVASAHQNLRCAIVLGDHLLGHVLGLIRLLDAGQSKVTDLEHAIRVDQQIARLDVAMQDAGRVQIFEAAQDLVQEHLDVVGGQVLWRHDYLVQIRLQQLRYHIAIDRFEEGRVKVETNFVATQAKGANKSLELPSTHLFFFRFCLVCLCLKLFQLVTFAFSPKVSAATTEKQPLTLQNRIFIVSMGERLIKYLLLVYSLNIFESSFIIQKFRVHQRVENYKEAVTLNIKIKNKNFSSYILKCLPNEKSISVKFNN